MDEVVSRRTLLAEYDRVHVGPPGGARKLIENAPAVDAVELPCKIGDEAWCIRGVGENIYVKSGIVGEMFFNSKMELVISVKHILKGKWGTDIFGSKAEAEEAARSMNERRKQDTICWNCKKSGGLCSWSSSYIPVKGWETNETWVKVPEKIVPSYCVITCPEFEEG